MTLIFSAAIYILNQRNISRSTMNCKSVFSIIEVIKMIHELIIANRMIQSSSFEVKTFIEKNYDKIEKN